MGADRARPNPAIVPILLLPMKLQMHLPATVGAAADVNVDAEETTGTVQLEAFPGSARLNAVFLQKILAAKGSHRKQIVRSEPDSFRLMSMLFLIKKKQWVARLVHLLPYHRLHAVSRQFTKAATDAAVQRRTSMKIPASTSKALMQL